MSGKLIYLDPNDTVTNLDGNLGKYSKEIPKNLEDYSIFVNLSVKRNGKFGDNISDLDLNFLSGKEINNKSYLTDFYSHINFEESINGELYEAIGIENIVIDFNSWYTPTIQIKFVDIRGASILMPTENDRVLNNQSKTSKFFSCFYSIPYPIFHLTIKGFYGQPVTYMLHCTEVKSELNSTTGNFELTTQFIGYTYAMLADLDLNYLRSATTCELYGKSYWDNTYGKNGVYKLNGSHFPTLDELKDNLFELNKFSTENNINDANSKRLNDIDNKLIEIQNNVNILLSYKKEVVDVTFKGNNIITNYSGGEYIICFDKNKDGYNYTNIDNDKRNRLIKLHSEINRIHQDLPCNILYQTNKSRNILDEVKFLPKNELSKFSFKVHHDKKYMGILDSLNLEECKKILGDVDVFVGVAVIDFNDIYYSLKKKYDNLSKEKQDIVDKINTETENNFKNYVGLTPSIGNIFKILFAHVDTFMYMLEQNVKNVKETHSNSEYKYPFPITYNTNNEETWVGDTLGLNREEVKLTNSLVNNIKKGISKDVEYSKINNIESSQNKITLLPFDNDYVKIYFNGELKNVNSSYNFKKYAKDVTFNDILYNLMRRLYFTSEDGLKDSIGKEINKLIEELKDEPKTLELLLSNGAEHVLKEMLNKDYFNVTPINSREYNEDGINIQDNEPFYGNAYFLKNNNNNVNLNNICTFCLETKSIGSEELDLSSMGIFKEINKIPKTSDLNVTKLSYSDLLNNFSENKKELDISKAIPSFYIEYFNMFSRNYKVSLFLSEAYNIQENIYGKAYLFLSSFKFNLNNLYKKFNQIKINLTKTEILFLGSLEYRYSSDEILTFQENIIDEFDKNQYFDGKKNVQIKQELGTLVYSVVGEPEEKNDFTTFSISTDLKKYFKDCFEKWVNEEFVLIDNDYGVISKINEKKIDSIKNLWWLLSNNKNNKNDSEIKKYLNSDNYHTIGFIESSYKIYTIINPTDKFHKLMDGLTQTTTLYEIGGGTFWYSKNYNKKFHLSQEVLLNDIKNKLTLKKNIFDNKNSIKDVVVEQKETSNILLLVYNYLKNISEKWVVGYEWKNQWLESDGEEIKLKNFKIVDRSNNDISDKLYIDINKYLNYNIETDDNYKTISLYSLITKILSDNNLTFIPLPSYYDISDDEGFKNIFEPTPTNEMIIPQAHPMFNCVYVGKPSSELDIYDEEIGDYINDGFDFNGGKIPTDFTTIGDGKVTAFGVQFGKQNQNYFTNIRLNMNNPTTTDASIQAIYNLSNVSSNKKLTATQNLYDIYTRMSFQVEVEMLGCAQIQPMMYFQLNNVALWHGAYLIFRVKHNITSNKMTTTFTGMRVNRVKTKIFDKINNYIDFVLPNYNLESLNLTSNINLKGVKGVFEVKDLFKNGEVPKEIEDKYGENMEKTISFLNLVSNKFDEQIRITSGFRDVNKNKSVGGSDSSAHLIGGAVDIQPINKDKMKKLKDIILEINDDDSVNFDQIMFEKYEGDEETRWVHLGVVGNNGVTRRDLNKNKIVKKT